MNNDDSMYSNERKISAPVACLAPINGESQSQDTCIVTLESRAIDRVHIIPKETFTQQLAHISRIAGEQKVNDLVRQGGEEGQDLFSMFSTWLGKKVFEYQFLWLGSTDYATNTPMLRRRNAPSATAYTPSDGERLEIRDTLSSMLLDTTARYDHLDHLTYNRVFDPPYTRLPIIESRVHPFFIIFNAGAKLAAVPNPGRFGLVALQTLELYNRWRCPLTPAGLFPGGSNPNGPYVDGQAMTTSQSSGLDGSDEYIPTQDSSRGTPSIVYDSSVNSNLFQPMCEDAVPSPASKVIDWLTDANSAAVPQEESIDTTLDEYRKEPSQQGEPCRWKEWVTSPPEMPELLREYHDNSQLSSYHWALYHECVNLMAPPGAHHVPMPWSDTDMITQGERLSNHNDTERDPSFDLSHKKQEVRANIPGPCSSIPEVVKAELSKLGQYCMLTLEPFPIDIAHIIAKATPKFKRNLFEAAWNKELDSLDVNSLENLMYLRSDLHRTFDEGRWALLPKLSLLIQISGAQITIDLERQYDLPDVVDLFSQFSTWEGKKTFEYQLLWLGKEKAPLLRRRVPAASNLGFLSDGDRASVSDACKRFQNRMAGRPELGGPDDSTPGSNATNKTDTNIDHIDDATLRREYASLLAETTDLYPHCAALEAENARLCRCADEPEHSQLSNDAEDSIGAIHVLDLISRYRIFAPPYTDFPLIESRVHPFFAILNAGEKLLNISNPNRLGPQVQLVLDLFHRWNRPLAPLVYAIGDGRDSGEHDDGQTSNEEQASFRDEDTQDSPGGTPSYDSSSNVPEPPTMGEDAVPSPTSKVIDWLTNTNFVAASQEESADMEDTNLEEYRKEPSQQAELFQWEEWATSPPVMPELLTDYYDNSQLSSYHWALYHECVNLMAPPGAHHVPMPWSDTGDIRPSFLRV
ncbi:hypothetical protein EYR38_002289 [Pleurotus pulmonarius]|nr:hypothetical protein EYR38_002289 [Pleurotus pulmonarius]